MKSPALEPCSNCGLKFGGAAVFTCTVCQQQFCVDCVTFEPRYVDGVTVAERVICWTHAGVGGAAGHQRHLRGGGHARA